MSDPLLPSLAGFKVWLFGLPVFVAIVAFWLGMLAIPLRAGREIRDLLYRVMSCVASSFMIGVPALIALRKYLPFVFEEAEALATMARLDPFAGFLILISCVMLVCSIPGPWVVGSVFLFLEKQKDRPIDDVIGDFRKSSKENTGP